MPITPKVKMQRTANIRDDLENSFEQRKIDSIEEPVRKRGRPKKVLAESQPAFSLDKFPFDFQLITAEMTKLSGEVLNVNS